MKSLLLISSLLMCSLAHAQFRERPSTTARRAADNATHVQGNLHKVLGFSVNGRALALCFSPQNDYIAVATNTTLALFNESGTHQLLVWDALKEPQVPFEDRPNLRATLAFAPDGKQLFFCGPQGLSVWSWPDGLSLDKSPVRAWVASNVYNLAVVDNDRVVCATKQGSSHLIQLRKASNGEIIWEKNSGLLPIAALATTETNVRTVVGTATGSQCYWSQWDIADGKQSLPIDLGAVNAFSAALSPDGKSASMVNKELSLITLETGEAKVAIAPYHPYSDDYYFYHRHYPHPWPYERTVDTGWTTVFSPDSNSVVTIGKEAVFYGRNTGTIDARIFFSNDPYPFPLPILTEAETDGVGAFSTDGKKFALVHQGRVIYSFIHDENSRKSLIQRDVQGASGIEVYALGAG